MLPTTSTLAFAKSEWATIQRKLEVGNRMDCLLTLFLFNSRLPSLSYDHPHLLVYQAI